MSVKGLWERCVLWKNDYEKVKLLEEEQGNGTNASDDERTKITSSNAFWNISNSIQGVAILAMPYVIKGGGWWSIFGMIIIAAISNYTGQILIDCHYDEVIDEATGKSVRVRVRQSYAEIGASIFPRHGKNVVLCIQVLELLFMATLYPIVFVSVIRELIPQLGFPQAVWISIFGLLMIPNIFLKGLHHISIMSSVTVASATGVFLAISLYCFIMADNWSAHGLGNVKLKDFVRAIGVVIASYSSQMYLSVIEADMEEPEKIGAVMNAGYTAMTVLKIGIGVVAFLTFGDKTSQVVTLNLPSGFVLTSVNIVVLVLAMSSYSLPMFTVFEILDQAFPSLEPTEEEKIEEDEMKERQKINENMKTRKKILLRVTLVLITLLMAISVPHFCLVLAFIGSFTGAFLEMVFPCCFYIMLKHEKLSRFTILLNILIVIFSLFFMGIGMYFSAYAIIKAFKLHTKEVWTVD